jgi:ornithine cyclodeaminase/alanine dehydrogenase-like protein (mu-crystallin family)
MMSKHAETPCIRHDDRSAFVFRGLGLADLALAALACRRASKVWVSEAFLIR